MTDSPEQTVPGAQWVYPQTFRAFALDLATLQAILNRAPREFTAQAAAAPAQIALPMPEGSLVTFWFVESPVMAPELAAEFPDIRTFIGTRVDDSAVTARFDFTPAGFHAYVRAREGTVYVEPLYRENPVIHAAYYRQDSGPATEDWRCLLPSGADLAFESPIATSPLSSGTQLRTYRLAVAGTGEFTQLHGGTVKAGLAAVVTVVNRVNAIYEPEAAIRLMLVANNDQIIYTSSTSDPYSGTDASALLSENQANLDAVIGPANYDVGHVLSGASGGLATLGTVCVPGFKARGQTGRGSASVDTFFVDYVAHELGHQFNARHTFNGQLGSCGDNRDGSTSYEPGSGSTILSYAGNCLADNVLPRSDLYFHAGTLDQILRFVTSDDGANCPVVTATGNRPPAVSAGPNYTIPKSTPFLLTAVGSDPDGEEITYCWEQMDLGPAARLTDPDNGSSPLFRSVKPSSDPSRVFPVMSSLIANTSSKGETLPTTTRTLHFRVTARDNRNGGGGVNGADMQVSVVGSAGPFKLTSHNTGGSHSNTTTVTWDVAGTATSPINATTVNLWLSTNNGQTFSVPLALNTPNDGSEVVTLPSMSSTVARLKIEAAGNIFFDICDAQFTITPVPPVPVLSIKSTALVAESCTPGNGGIDAGETVTVNFTLRNDVLTKTTNLVATLLPTGGVTAPGAPQTYGALSGAQQVSRPFTFTAVGACGGSITATLQLIDNALDLGTVSTTLPLGATVTNTLSRQNSTPFTIPASGTAGPASLYPSTVEVSGVEGKVSKVRITLTSLTHAFAGDLDVLLVSPSGLGVMLMSDAGNGTNITSATLTFDDTVSAVLIPEGRIVTSTNQPTNYDPDSDNFPAPASAGPYAQTLSAFNGQNPNGTWSLYVLDDAAADTGSLGFGWRLNMTTTNLVCCGSAPDNAPTISDIANQATDEDTPTPPIPFTVADAETPASGLIVSAVSSDTNLLPNANILLGGSGTNRTLTLMPATNAFGSTTLTVSVSDGVNLASDTFLLTVNPVNDPPVLAGVPDQTVHAGTVVWATNVATDVESPPQTLTFSFATSPPPGVMLDAMTGVFRWLTVDANAGITNIIRARVVDNGTPPQAATNVFRIAVLSRPVMQTLSITNNVLTLRWSAIAGLKYRAQRKEALDDAQWMDIVPDVVATGSVASAVHTPVGTATSRFYRVLLVP